ncbi:4'-phosphopantetheinyl transferase family protein [Psychrobacter sp. 1U2]|uniref:4'-phosphopantetheinyl transferase family protein n=1 Tax=Psychrobacter sp. 1U2 TaxID=3453577 RepID=UPI003F45C0D7
MILLNDIHYTQLTATHYCAIGRLESTAAQLWINYSTAIYTFALSASSLDNNSLSLQTFHLVQHPHNLLASEFTSLASTQQTLLNKKVKRQSQRTGVRLLLNKLLVQLGIVDTLDESAFPYRLKNHRHYVCFSHSGDTVAVALSYDSAIGIDIEVNSVAWQVAKRFYHPSEIAMLEQLSLDKRDYLVRLLWQIKESLIKINQTTLAAGLGRADLPLVQMLIEYDSADNSADNIVKNNSSARKLFIKLSQDAQRRVAYISNYQTIVVF